jgi:hypothetical protein
MIFGILSVLFKMCYGKRGEKKITTTSYRVFSVFVQQTGLLTGIGSPD